MDSSLSHGCSEFTALIMTAIMWDLVSNGQHVGVLTLLNWNDVFNVKILKKKTKIMKYLIISWLKCQIIVNVIFIQAENNALD